MSWPKDLARLRAGELGFDAFARRHRGIVRQLAAPWARRCPSRLCVDDVEQEILIEVWRSVDLWEPDGMPLPAFVRMRIRNRLLKMTDRHVKGPSFDARFLEKYGYEPARERSVGDKPEGKGLRRPELETRADEQLDSRRRAAVILGCISADSRAAISRVVASGVIPRPGTRARREFLVAAHEAAAVAEFIEQS